jgi:uncharacterized surface protein with fasciclin (FAS1) repeats/plastocyanin
MNFNNCVFSIIGILIFLPSVAQENCFADHTILLSNYTFTPSNLTIAPGESVAFINVEGTHDVNGITNSITEEPFNNPVPFYLNQTVGSTNGTCMGVITFDTPGIYNYDCSIGFHADLGMTASINVDAFTLSDLFANNMLPESFQSGYALNTYFSTYFSSDSTPEVDMNGNEPYTVFLPNDLAVSNLIDQMHVSQFDMLGFYDLPTALKHHVVDGIFMSSDLQNNQELISTYGQNLSITESNGNFYVNDAMIVATDFTADNGVVHVIDKTLSPEGLPAMSVWHVIEESENHQFFENALLSYGFNDPLTKHAEIDDNGFDGNGWPGPFTVFAPTNNAFALLAESLNLTESELIQSSFFDDLIAKHVVESRNLSTELYNNQSLSTYANENILITADSIGLYADGVLLSVTDVLAYNGVVHIIDAVIPVDFPTPVGTCGTWTLKMYDDEGNGWTETELYVEVGGEIVSVETMPAGSYSSLEFGVDNEELVNLYYLPASDETGQSYAVYDQNNQIVAASGQSGSAGNSIGLLACPSPPTCGMIEVVMSHEYNDGWWGNTLDVYKNEELYLTIPYYYGPAQSTKIPANQNDIFDFIYSSGGSFEPQYEDYVVYGPSGEIIVDQSLPGIPESAYDVVFCESNNSIQDLEEIHIQAYPNPSRNSIHVYSNKVINSTFKIMDIQGRTMIEDKMEGNAVIVNISKLSKGVYTIIFGDQKSSNIRFFKN